MLTRIMFVPPNCLYIGQILMHLDIITRRQLARVRRKQIRRRSLKRIGEIMIEFGYVTEKELNRALSLQKDITESEIY